MLSGAAALSSLAYALVWAGIGVAVWCVSRSWSTRDWTPHAHISLILVATLALESAISGVSARFEHPHYHNGAWIAFVLLAWLAVDSAIRLRGRLRVTATATTALLSVALAIAVGTLAVRLHGSGGTRDVYGPTIDNQQRVARAMALYAPQSSLSVEVSHYQRFPHTLQILRELNPGTNANAPEERLEIRYRSADPAIGTIALVAR